MSCPLCLNFKIQHYYQDKVRDYWQCENCLLVFVRPEQFVSTEKEKAIYDLHENSANDAGYRNFLNKLLAPLIERLSSGSLGLDFGCGPGPTISVMMRELDFKIENYDLFYANNKDLLNKKYEFITCTEVVEHLHKPFDVLTLLHGLLTVDGYLGIMTKRLINKNKFRNWHYKNDITHVCFYSDQTFEFIASNWNFSLDIIGADVLFLKKNNTI